MKAFLSDKPHVYEFYSSARFCVIVDVIYLFIFSKRELQFLADQEKISSAAIKKTTLDKVLQQPGVTGAGVAGKSGISFFNNSNPKHKKY